MRSHYTCMSGSYDHPAATSTQQLLAECNVRTLRRAGPGGQHRNKVETAVSLRHLPSGVHAEASERRGQAQNQTPGRVPAKGEPGLGGPATLSPDYVPSPLWQSRCGSGVLN